MYSKPFYCKNMYKTQCRNSKIFGEDYKLSLWVLLRDKQYTYIGFPLGGSGCKTHLSEGTRDFYVSSDIFILLVDTPNLRNYKESP